MLNMPAEYSYFKSQIHDPISNKGLNMTVLIKPCIEYSSNCPYCQNELKSQSLIWTGMHICIKSNCSVCNAEAIEDLPVGHAVNYPYLIDVKANKFFRRKPTMGNKLIDDWLGNNLLQALQHPNSSEVEIQKEIFKDSKRVIVLNCIDHLYGHTLLKLLNADSHLQSNSDFGLVVIVQKLLRWMVPEGVAEVWTVDIPLRLGQSYYPCVNKFISDEIDRFDEVFVSKAHSHPDKFDITNYTKTPIHDFDAEEFRITFTWREDRLWLNYFFFRVLRKIGLIDLCLLIQSWKVRRLFSEIKRELPSAIFTVVGLGRKMNFPEWVQDLRVEKFDEATERATCKIYSQSRLVIGVHGSNMLLPSAHAGMTIDLMPDDRLRNICQDILYQKADPRLATFCYRFPSASTNVNQLAMMATSMIDYHDTFIKSMQI
jgi:hypothetical protein